MNEVGKSLLRLLEARRHILITTFEVDLQVCTVSMESQDTDCLCLTNEGGDDSITMAVVEKAINCNTSPGPSSTISFDSEMPADVKKAFCPDLSQFLGNLFRVDYAHHVVFDCTNDKEASKYHAEWLSAGVHVVTANNTGLSGTKELREAIDAAEPAHGKLSAKYLREVTVGGGLPVINTLRMLLSSGDKIRRVDGIFSVSMSYIMFRIFPPPKSAECGRFDEKMTGGVFRGDIALSPGVSLDKACSFSQAFEEAVSLGLMENDPVHDVGNEYSARVMMVLAKELGFERNLSMEDIQARSDKLAESLGGNLDEAIGQRVSAAAERDYVLRHIASIDVASQSVDIKIIEVPKNHVFAVTPPTCECVRFFTQRYQPYPLVMQGPAAGADCTSSALLAEVLSLMSSKIGPKSGSL
jgi:aspartokinase/homoserine dehydrogenase 1